MFYVSLIKFRSLIDSDINHFSQICRWNSVDERDENSRNLQRMHKLFTVYPILSVARTRPGNQDRLSLTD